MSVAKGPILSADYLHSQLCKLGEMMGDGLHEEPGGAWIAKEYRQVAKALGYGPARANNSEAINQAVTEKLKSSSCPKCNGQFKQTRSGSLRVVCVECGAKYQFKRRSANAKRKTKG